MMMTVKCPNCKAEAEVDAGGAGQLADCPSCGKEFTIRKPAATFPIRRGPVPEPTSAAASRPTSDPLNRVVVVDFDISFISVLGIMFKVIFAALVVSVIFGIIGFALSVVILPFAR
jgi:hypothetical protein